MTVQKAIQDANIQDAIHCVKVELEEEVCEECRFHRLCHIWCKDVSRIKLEALEKQIPKKAKNKIKRPNSFYGTCPICDRQLVTDKYCPRCGQRIDWSEENDSIHASDAR